MNDQNPDMFGGAESKKEPAEKNKKKTAIKAFAILCGVIALLWLGFNLFFKLPSGETSPDEMNPLSGFDKYDVLLMGIDGRDEIDIGDRTDTIILATIDTKTMKARMLTIPRDTRIQYKDEWMKINGVYGIDGPQGTCSAVEDLLGTKIDRYAVVDFNGVIELVNLMGGIDVDVPKRMYKPLEKIDLQPGMQHLDGLQALGYMRYRDATLSDFDRSERQKQVIIQLADKMMQPSNLLKISEISGTAMKYLETNLSTHEIIGFAKEGKTILNNGVDSILLPGVGKTIHGGWYYIPDLEQLKQAEMEANQIVTNEGAGDTQTNSGNSAPKNEGDAVPQTTDTTAAEEASPDTATGDGTAGVVSPEGEIDPNAPVIVPGSDISGEYVEIPQEENGSEPASGETATPPDGSAEEGVTDLPENQESETPEDGAAPAEQEPGATP